MTSWRICTLPVRFSGLSSLYIGGFCRSSSRSQLTAKGAGRVDVTYEKKNLDSMAKCACSPLALMPVGFPTLKPYCMCLSFAVVFCPEYAKPSLKLDPLQLLICVSPRKVATLCPAKKLRNGHDSSQSETASSADFKLSLFYDGEGVIRCRERPKHVNLPERLTHPILVPASSVLATLIIKDSHRQVPHPGTPQTLAWARIQYWLPNGRASVKRVIKDC